MKRIFDILASATALCIFALPLAALALGVRIAMGRPVIFRQARPGLGGEIFVLLKFRTMRDGAEADADRMTRFGRFLRASSLDELPELWNVLRGDMSLVGPRPLLTDYMPFYTVEQQHRHAVRPGLTGWAQVNGRNAQSWDERLRLDLEYVERQSFAFDLYILIRTVGSVLGGRGVESEPGVPMRRFDEDVRAGRAKGQWVPEESGTDRG